MRQSIALACAVAAGIVAGAAGTVALRAQAAPPAFLLAEVQVTDPETFKEYAQKYPATLTPYGAKIVAANKGEALEGAAPAGRVVVIQYPSMKAAKDSGNDPAYQSLIPVRQKSSTARIFLVEGVPQ